MDEKQPARRSVKTSHFAAFCAHTGPRVSPKGLVTQGRPAWLDGKPAGTGQPTNEDALAQHTGGQWAGTTRHNQEAGPHATDVPQAATHEGSPMGLLSGSVASCYTTIRHTHIHTR